MAAARRLAYETDRRASALRRRRSGAVGLVMPDVSGPYRWRLAHAIEAEARRRGYFLSLRFSYGGRGLDRNLIRALVGEGVEGLILLGSSSRESSEDVDYLLRLGDVGVPFVFADIYVESVSAPFVGSDNEMGARLATEHLLRLGHRRIAYLSQPVEFVSSARERLNGFTSALADWGVEQGPQFVIDRPAFLAPRDGDAPDPDRRWMELEGPLGRKLSSLPVPPSAIVCATTDDACVALKWAHDRELSIPEQLSVVRFDEFPFFAAIGLEFTFVRQPAEEIGRHAIDTLVSRISEAGSAEPLRLRLPPTLVVGNTTACPREDREEVSSRDQA